MPILLRIRLRLTGAPRELPHVVPIAGEPMLELLAVARLSGFKINL